MTQRDEIDYRAGVPDYDDAGLDALERRAAEVIGAIRTERDRRRGIHRDRSVSGRTMWAGEPGGPAPRWADHRSRTSEGLWISEPYGLDEDDLWSLAGLSVSGWEVSIRPDYAQWLPGFTLAVVIKGAS